MGANIRGAVHTKITWPGIGQGLQRQLRKFSGPHRCASQGVLISLSQAALAARDTKVSELLQCGVMVTFGEVSPIQMAQNIKTRDTN